MQKVSIHGRALEYVHLQPAQPRNGAPVLVFLHEGLGSISLWRDFPRQIVEASGCEAVVYSRQGYGGSDPRPTPRDARYLHEEALEYLPALCDALGLDAPLLCGHSDGASIALIHAGCSGRPLAGVVAMAPHVMVEACTLAGISAATEAWRDTDLCQRLGRHHAAPERVFRAWSDTWLAPGFRDWNIETCLPEIACPVLAIQGEDDEYGTMDQIDRIAAQAPDVELLKLPRCGHSPHRDQPEAVSRAIVEFVARVTQTLRNGSAGA